MLIDFRESLYAELREPEFRREFIRAYYEQDGVAGIRRALQCLTEADRYAETGTLTPEKPKSAKRVVRRAKLKRVRQNTDSRKTGEREFSLLRNKIQAHGLDFALMTKAG